MLLDSFAFLLVGPSNIWFDGLQFQGARPETNTPLFIAPVICTKDAAQVRVTNCSFVGDGGQMRGASSEIGCRAYFAGAHPWPCRSAQNPRHDTTGNPQCV